MTRVDGWEWHRHHRTKLSRSRGGPDRSRTATDPMVMSARKKISQPPVWRRWLILASMWSVFALLSWRVVDLQLTEHAHLQAQGNARYFRELNVTPDRGRILDRNGQVLAVSTPVGSLWAEPSLFCAAPARWQPMLGLVKVTEKQLHAACAKHKNSKFMYIRRRLSPMLAQQVQQLAIPGVGVRREYKRYYPGGPAGAHLIGFTDVDDIGQQGLERYHQTQLGGHAGRIGVLKDRVGNFVEPVESLQPVRHGQDLVISVDQRIQSLASDYLEAALRKHRALAGSVVVLAVPSGEILAMVNSPQFNPNDRSTMTRGALRNRSVTDLIEPGSTIKPFTVGMALESGKVDAATMVDTAPGTHQVGGHTIHDVHDYGMLSVADVLVRSSNVGISKLGLAFPYDDLFDTLVAAGFGQRAGGLPGEVAGMLKRRTRDIEHATLSYGYGLSVTPLQLARAYTVFATDGELLPVTLEAKAAGYRAAGSRVFSANTIRAIRPMLERAASPEGTARKARIPRYRVGGKTGTIHKLFNGTYQNKRYVSAFVGIAPISAPRFVMAVIVDQPRGQFYYGGDVAAPVFANLMQDLMRLYNIKPDAPLHAPLPVRTAAQNATGATEASEASEASPTNQEGDA